MPLIRRTPDVAPDPAPAAAELFGALNDRASDVRSAAARRLASSPGGPEALGVALGRETDDRVREAIFTSLTLADSAAAVEALSPHLRSDDAGLRRGTLDALRAMSLTARPYLPTLLADPDADVRLLACEVVRELPSTDATPLICALLERETELNVCASAVDVVAMALTVRLLGFHLLLLPTFAVELIPVVDTLPTWTACVAAVIFLRSREAKKV